MKPKFLHGIAATALLISMIGSALAAPISFPFRFADPQSAAQAVGSITFESTLLANPGVLDVNLPDPSVLALSVTVSGSAAGNGTFGMADFSGVVFDTNGGTLDFGSQLVGQPTSGGSWGTPDGGSGDFNLFSGGISSQARYSAPSEAPAGLSSPPNGVFYFTLGANGGDGEAMVLTSMGGNGVPATPAASLPVGRGALLAIAGLLAFSGLAALRRRSRRI